MADEITTLGGEGGSVEDRVMNRSQWGVLVLFLTGVATMFLFPPFFGMDTTSDGQIHGSLGHHPAWNPPSQERAYSILLERGVLPESGVHVSDLAVRRNVVGLSVTALSLSVLCLICFLLLRSRREGGGSGERVVVGPD
jgi:hypothetical protein